MKAVEIPTITIENFVAGLEKTLVDYPKDAPRSVLYGGCEQIAWLVKLAEVALCLGGISEAEQERLLWCVRDLHKALATPDHFQSAEVMRVVNKSADRFEQTVKQAYAAAAMELLRGLAGESEESASNGKAFGFEQSKVIGWRDTAKRKGQKYPLLSDHFWTALRESEQAYPGRRREQYEAVMACAASHWGAKI